MKSFVLQIVKHPKKAYFELLDQPPKIIPYTFNEETASKNNTPNLISETYLFVTK